MHMSLGERGSAVSGKSQHVALMLNLLSPTREVCITGSNLNISRSRGPPRTHISNFALFQQTALRDPTLNFLHGTDVDAGSLMELISRDEVLADDLEELHSLNYEYQHPRSRRDEEAVTLDKCKQRRKKYCCAEETLEQNHDNLKELKRECFREVTGRDKDGPKPEVDGREARGEFDPFRCDKVDKHRKEMTCVFQCVGKKKDLLDEQGNPIEEGLTSFVKETMSKESWFSSVQDKVISTCLAEARNATANRDTSDTESCNPTGIKLVHCLFREIQLGCPADQIKDQKVCNRVRDKIKRYNDFTPQTGAYLHDE